GGREGACIDPRVISGRAGAGRFRGALRSSGARCAGARCGRQRIAGGDRRASVDAFALLGGARSSLDRTLGYQRGAQGRSGGARDPHRYAQGACGAGRHGHLRGPWAQVSALGAGALPCAPRGGARKGPGSQEVARRGEGVGHASRFAVGWRASRSTGMMTGRGDGSADAAGGPARHVPVLLGEVLEHLSPRGGGAYVDGTLGAGGYTRAILAAAPDLSVLGIDRDPDASAGGADLVAASGGRLVLAHGHFGDLDVLAQDAG